MSKAKHNKKRNTAFVYEALVRELTESVVKNNKNKQKTDPNIIKTQERIEKILGLKVNILNKKNNSGKITIEYKDLDQFELISELLTKS